MLRPGALGDTLLAVPALRSLRSRFGQVTLAAHAGAARLLAALGEVDEGLAFDDPRLGWLFRPVVAPHAEQVVAWLDPAHVPGLRDALVVAPSRPAAEQHCAEYLLETLAPLGVSRAVDDRPLGVAPLASEEVLVHPGSGAAAKNWSAEHFADVILRVERPVRLIVGEADRVAAEAVELNVGRALPRLEHASLEELAQRLAGCRGYLGNDSGVSHLAGLCGARTLVLFGPSSPVVWRPLGRRVTVLGFDETPTRVAAALSASA